MNYKKAFLELADKKMIKGANNDNGTPRPKVSTYKPEFLLSQKIEELADGYNYDDMVPECNLSRLDVGQRRALSLHLAASKRIQILLAIATYKTIEIITKKENEDGK